MLGIHLTEWQMKNTSTIARLIFASMSSRCFELEPELDAALFALETARAEVARLAFRRFRLRHGCWLGICNYHRILVGYGHE